jgi:hypothetical protein
MHAFSLAPMWRKILTSSGAWHKTGKTAKIIIGVRNIDKLN